MKIFILLLLISPIQLRLHNDDIYELDNLLNKYDKYKYRPDESYISNDDDNDQDFPSSYQHKKVHPSRKKIDNTDRESETDDSEDSLVLQKTTTQPDELSNTVSCFNGYNVQSEQLVKVKELKNGARMIQHTLIDKRTLSANVDIKDECMLTCCAEKTCDLAMISEQPTHVNKIVFFYLTEVFI